MVAMYGMIKFLRIYAASLVFVQEPKSLVDKTNLFCIIAP
jgi:hypothetical protein